jgi:hypothetical protein
MNTAPQTIAARSTLESTDAGAKLRITSAKGGIVVLLIWLLIWAYVVVWEIGRKPFQGADQNLWFVVVFFFAIWLGGLLVLLWCVAGSECLVFQRECLTLARALGGFTYWRRDYPLGQCVGLRFVEASSWRPQNMFRALGIVGPGTIAFDCNGLTVTFGLALDDRDARAVVTALEPLFAGHLTSASS